MKKIPKKTFKNQLFLEGNNLTTEDIVNAVRNNTKLAISKKVEIRIKTSHQLLQKFIKEKKIIYGVNTGMGGFVNWLIPHKFAQQLQENLIAGVATNVSSYLDDQISKASIIVRLNSLSRGASAISLKNFNKLLAIYNSEIIPCIPSKGSLGASGDLGPLACIALVAIGKWKAKYQGQIITGKEALKFAKIDPMKLSYKEGLSLINGTSTMVAFAALLIEDVITLIKSYDAISCLTFEGLKAKKKPFNPIVHKQKLHSGQLQTAENIWKLLKNSKMIVNEKDVEKFLQNRMESVPTSEKSHIEDAYSIRCTPHIIGPIRDNVKSIKSIIFNEINSSSDNPLILCEHNDIFHNGHFHGQYISMAMDQLAISLTTLSNLSDRRIDRFMDKNNSNNLPPFLCLEKPGLRFGLMGGQFMAASLTGENRSLCNPVSIQSLSSTGDFQDIVSLGLVAARRAREIYNNTAYIITFELLCAAQAVEIRGLNSLSKGTKNIFDNVRKIVPYLSTDQCLTDYLEKLSEFIKSGKLLEKLENIVGKITL
jgi:histidine ammonia-lyase